MRVRTRTGRPLFCVLVPKRSRSAQFLAEVLVEVVEDLAAAREPFLSAPVGHHEPSDQGLHAVGFVPPEFRVLEVDVVNDFGDRLDRRVGQAGVAEQRLEAASGTLIGEFGLEQSKRNSPMRAV